jgi:pantoate--beta-alanine ligase
MEIISTVSELRKRLQGETNIAFVPTMGNLHEGHLDLVRIAREQGTCVVVSIYVNPLQFGVNEDYGTYPRTLQSDCEKMEKCGVNIVFTPTDQELYPCPQQVTVEPPLENDLCGKFRPGHFRGVATVVLKLFNIVQPRVAVFGKKDYQQLYVISQVVKQLNLPVKIVGGDTVRAADGLALSSRNQYLSVGERAEAVFLHQSLVGIRQTVQGGDKRYAFLENQAIQMLTARGWAVEYFAVRDQDSLMQPEGTEQQLIVLAAARLGKTRLIDNLEICI